MAGIMCEYFSIFCHSIMPPPVHCPNLKGVKIMKARISRKFFCLLLTVVMVCTLLPITALAAGSSGSIDSASITQNAVSFELKDVTFAESVAVELYSGDTLLTTATLNTNKLGAGSYQYLTCCIATETADEYWPLTSWTPRDNVVPDKAVLFVDGSKLAEKTFKLNADAWAALPGTVLPCSIESAVITHDNGVLKNAVSVELKDVTFAESVAVKLYSGETLLTTATLNTGVLTVDKNYPFVTCCIPTEGEDAAWSLTSWTPKDDVVPDKAVLVVDGRELAEKTFKLNAEDWAALPGTAFPYSGSIERVAITHDNGTLKNAVSVDLKNVNFESSVRVELYRGKTLLTTATLNTDRLEAGSYPYLTCCIATQTADDYWSLTRWTPKDNVVPNKVVLFVDDNEMATMEFTLDDAEWKALPGTVPPASNVTNGTASNVTNGTASNNDKLDNVPKTGDSMVLVMGGALSVFSLTAAAVYVTSRKKFHV